MGTLFKDFTGVVPEELPFNGSSRLRDSQAQGTVGSQTKVQESGF